MSSVRPAALLPESRALLVLYAAIVVYAATFQAQLPVQPFLVKSLSTSAVESFTSLRTFIAVLQLLGSLLSGWLIDRVGARNVLLLALGASALSYAITARATTLALLFAAQVPTVFQHAVLAARAYATTVVPAGDARALVLGRITFAYGVGMLVGPSAGGVLASIDLTLAAAASAVGALAAAVFVWALLPEAEASGGGGALKEHGGGGAAGDAGGYARLLGVAGVAPALAVKAIFVLALAVFQGAFSLLAFDRFALDAAGMGAILAWVGALSAVGSTVVVPLVAARGWGATRACVGAAAALAASLAAFAAATTQTHLFLLCVPQTLAAVVFQTLNAAALSALVPAALQGALHAADMAISSGLRIAAPAAAAALITRIGYWSVGVFTGAAAAAVALLLGAGVGTAEAPPRAEPATP